MSDTSVSDTSASSTAVSSTAVSSTAVSDTSMRTLPPPLAELVEDFAAVGPKDRLELLLELSRELPGLPERYAGERAGMEQVHECQSPLFLAVEVERGGADDNGADDSGADDSGADDAATVHLFFDAPPEAPTTRGFAGILAHGLDNRSAREVLAVPDDFYVRLGLGEAVSPLRLRGMAAMLARIKRQVRLQLSG